MSDPGKFAEQLDQENQSSPSMDPVPVPEDRPVEYLIDRILKVVPEQVQMGTEPITTIASVLAQLYQAQALRGICDILCSIDQNLTLAIPKPALPDWKEVSQTVPERVLELRDILDQLSDGIDEALDPQLSREEVVIKLKDLYSIANEEDHEDEEQG